MESVHGALDSVKGPIMKMTVLGCIIIAIVCAAPPLPAEEGLAASKAPLPKVLIIGDSISIGYTPHAAEMLEGKAAITHNPGNAQHTGAGLEKLEAWVGDEDWAVIHFNWGLHDLCYRSPASKEKGRRDKVNGKITTRLKQYEENLDQLVIRLKKTGASLIWASTTVVPDGEDGRIVGDDKRYNEAAARVMKKHGVTINDIYGLTKESPPALFKGPGNVHYKQEGSEKIAQQVAEAISRALPKNLVKTQTAASGPNNPPRDATHSQQ